MSEVLTLKPLPLEALHNGSQLLQTAFWGEFKSAGGWKPRAFSWELSTGAGRETGQAGSGGVEPDGAEPGGPETKFRGQFLILERTFPGGFSMAYVPYGPKLSDKLSSGEISSVLMRLAVQLRSYLSRKCFVIRWDLTGGTRVPINSYSASENRMPENLVRPLRRAPYRVQPPDTVLLQLTSSEEELLAGMHKKCRYNIRLAQKKGVEVQSYTGKEALELLPSWYRLYRETSQRDGIALHPESYYRRLFKLDPAEGTGKVVHSAPRLYLYLAGHQDELLAGIIVSRFGKRSVYLYGASAGRKRELMPNHLLQWRAIQDARREGAEEYDFFGIPPTDNPRHPMHGLWRFKTGFGGDICHYYGAWDYPLKPLLYSLYRVMEKLRGWLAARRKR